MVPSIPDRPDAVEIGDLVASVARRIRRAANRDLEPLGITASQMRALRVLDHHGGPRRMSELADDLRIARRSATSVVDDLVARGLCTRAPDPTDGRSTVVSLTPRARALLHEVRRRRTAATADLTAALSHDERRTLRDLLARLDAPTDVHP